MKKLFLAVMLLLSASLVFGQASVTYTNAGTTGTTLNSLAKINTTNNAVITATTDVAVPAYIVVAGNGTTGLGVLAVAGQANCTMDSTIASAAGGDYVINSVTTAGDCHAQSAAPSYGTWVVGTLASGSTTSGSVAAVTINSGFFTGTVPLTSVATQTANTVTANVTSGTASPTAAAIPSGIQNYVAGAGYNQASAHQVQAPLVCADSTASGTAQSCTTSPSFTPAAGDCVIYTTTTANTGAGLTLNVDALGAKSVAKWQNVTTLAANDVRANTENLACYDGTNWELDTIGNAPSGGTPTWDTITNAAGALTLANGTNATTFNQTSAANWTWANTTAATVTVPQNSPILNLNGTGWVGAGTSGLVGWTNQVVPTVGLNPNNVLAWGTTGTSTGHPKWTFPNSHSITFDNGVLQFAAASGSAIQFASGSDLVFNGNNSSNAITATIGDSSSGTSLVVNYATTTPGQKLIIASMLKATAALTAGQTIKIDTANASSVVVAAVGDVTGGTVMGFVANSPLLGAVAQLALPGSIITTPLLGTGTCTVGQFVINDTTTGGRVKCTGTYTAGTVLGYAVTAQASVGSAVSVYVWPL